MWWLVLILLIISIALSTVGGIYFTVYHIWTIEIFQRIPTPPTADDNNNKNGKDEKKGGAETDPEKGEAAAIPMESRGGKAIDEYVKPISQPPSIIIIIFITF